MGNILSRRLMLLGLAGLLALASPGPAAAVFCIAGDGHAAVEVLASPCCEDGLVPYASTMIIESADSGHPCTVCGPCVDLQLTSPSRIEKPSEVAIPVCAQSIMFAGISTLDISVRIGIGPPHSIDPSPTLELLATVVLLT